LFPKIHYVLLQDPDIQGRIRSDLRTFLEELRPPILFDEIQNAPELLSYVRTLIDTAPRRMGQWLFTGSQESPLMQRITESMAGLQRSWFARSLERFGLLPTCKPIGRETSGQSQTYET
jgi:predicted AAA+ superfamily ATPase